MRSVLGNDFSMTAGEHFSQTMGRRYGISYNGDPQSKEKNVRFFQRKLFCMPFRCYCSMVLFKLYQTSMQLLGLSFSSDNDFGVLFMRTMALADMKLAGHAD
jgi:hypothetical protein